MEESDRNFSIRILFRINWNIDKRSIYTSERENSVADTRPPNQLTELTELTQYLFKETTNPEEIKRCVHYLSIVYIL